MRKIVYVFYFIFLIFFVFYSYLFIDPGFFYLHSFFTNFFQLHRTITTSAFIISVIFFFGFYAYFLKQINSGSLGKKGLMQLIAATLCILLFAYPAMLSFDIFNYIATAKVTFFYHENPYIIMPIEFLHDPLLLFMHAPNKTALYAPVWIALTGVPYLLGFGNFLVTLCNFKLLAVIFYLLTVWLIWKMTKNITTVTLFALNPLVLIETLVSAHNDIVMMFLLLASIHCMFANKKGWGSAAYIASIGIKYATLILAPPYIVHAVKPLPKKKFLIWTTILMYAIFLLSSLREEIYPWYGLWFLLPATFLFGDNLLTWISITLSGSLLLRYIPFMLLGTYFGPTPFLKIIFMVIPVVLATIVYIITHRKIHLV